MPLLDTRGRAPALGRRSARPPLAIVALLEIGLCAVLAALFFAVQQGWTDEWDRRMLMVFRNSTDLSRGLGPLWLPETIRDITSLGSTSVLAAVIVVAAGFMLAAGWWASLVTLVGSVGSAQLVCLGLKHLAARARPDLIPGAPHVFTSSFPSSHAMISVLTYVLLAALMAQRTGRRSMRIYAFAVAAALTIAVGLSRIYLGVHYPTDVLAGWTAGLAWALLCWSVAAGWCVHDAPVRRPP